LKTQNPRPAQQADAGFSQVHSLLLVSRNTKVFPADEPGIRVPYKV
jgi:hypothetical protein